MIGVDAQTEAIPIEWSAAPRRARVAAEVGLIFFVFFLWGGGPAPDTNEAHYLAKARHYWDPSWCAGDFFLESADAHLAFYWAFGWVAALLPLPAAAWVGRLTMWVLQAWAWRRLSWAVAPRPWFSVLSAALFIVLLDLCELAGEWVADGVEAKSFAFVLVFLGIEAIVRNRWNAAWLFLGAAAAFHVLVGGWSVVAAGVAWLASPLDRPRLRAMLPGLLGGGLLSLPGLIPAWTLTRGLDPGLVAEANQVYVFTRLSHHLVPSVFPPSKYAAHLTLLAAFVLLCVITRRYGTIEGGLRRLWGLTAGAVLIGLAGVLVYFATRHDPALAAGLLRFYFFRLSDAFVPLGAALTLGALLTRLERGGASLPTETLVHPSLRRPAPWLASLLLIGAMLLAAVGIGARFFLRQADFRPGADRQSLPVWDDRRQTQEAYEAWVRTCRWIRENTPPDARFLTPRSQQTFKWYAHRPEVVSWKDVPQDAKALVEWRRRFQEIYGPIGWGGLALYDDGQLLRLARKYDAQFLVIDRTRATRPLGFELVYPTPRHRNAYYEVYRLPDDSE